ncbi:hypothetical protein [Ekhidna sp.]|uniref:hypothetical protein n=1 Tax=Ekhidna sp. TaxID=2608089 RepID=UPI003C7AA1AE
MKNLIFIFLLLGTGVSAQESPTIKELLNHVVGGTWSSTNSTNEGKPEDYKLFFMSFKNWADDSSVTGSIFGVQNNGDTIQLIEVWNFIDRSKGNLFYVQRTTWGWYGTGTISRYEEKHLDIQFKITTPEGQQFYTRDLHYIDSKHKMRAITFHKATEDEEWKEASRSEWTRIIKQ